MRSTPLVRYPSHPLRRLVVAAAAAALAVGIAGSAGASDDPPCVPGPTPGSTVCPPPSNTGVLNVWVELEPWTFIGSPPSSCIVRVHMVNLGPGSVGQRPWSLSVPGTVYGPPTSVLATGATETIAPGGYAMFQQWIGPETTIGGYPGAIFGHVLTEGLQPLRLVISGPTRSTTTYLDIEMVGRDGYCNTHAGGSGMGGGSLPPVP